MEADATRLPAGRARAEGASNDPWIGRELEGRYRIEGLLGEGGIGRVYRARHLALNRPIALKVLHDEYGSVASVRERFRREIDALAALSHPNIVSVVDSGVTDGVPYVAMELLEGCDLAALLRRGPIEPARGLEIVRQMLRALSHAHRQGIVHRDLKPHNVFVQPLEDGNDHVVVLDFGLARFLDRVREGNPLTQTGAMLGTPAYMPPEQALGGRADARADVYAAGLVLFEVLAGQRPFRSPDPSELLRAHLIEAPPPLATVARDLDTRAVQPILDRALAKEPAERYADAGAMLGELEHVHVSRRAAAREVVIRAGASAENSEWAVDAATAATVLPIETPAGLPVGRGGSQLAAGPVGGFDGADPRAPLEGETEAGAGTGTVGAAGVGSAPLANTSDAVGSVPRALAPAPRLRSSRVNLLAGLVAAVVLGGGAIALLVAVLVSSDREPVPAPAMVPPPPTPSPPAALPTSIAPRDPLAGELPEPLATFRARIERGQKPSQQALRPLFQWNRAHPNDPRGRLLLGRTYTDRRALSDALPEYVDAYALDPSVVAYPPLLPDLLEMARSGALHRQAVEAIGRMYGVEALAAVEAELARPRLRREERERLERLRAHLTQ